MERPTRITVAAILQLGFSLYAIVTVIPLLSQGAAAANAADGPPYAVLVLGLITAVAGLVSAYGLWRNQRWGKILTVVLRAVDGLSALPGVFFAPTVGWQSAATVGVALSILVIVLVLWPSPRPKPVEA